MNFTRPCPKCGKIDRNWEEEQRPQPSVKMSTLKNNQCVGAGINGKGHMLYTHHCNENSLAGVK